MVFLRLRAALAASKGRGRGAAQVPTGFAHQVSHGVHVARSSRGAGTSGQRTGIHLDRQTGVLQRLVGAVGDERPQRRKFFGALLPVVEHPDFLGESVRPKLPCTHQKMGVEISLVAACVRGMQSGQHHTAIPGNDVAGNLTG
ncbi:MAG: hypothetical protein ABS97_02920 [Lysobacteraceae bacterium SCN 69-320]|nr:MAG: hypothetical protein ABS97_02920 [Xanthomonadaceae bacterium SCN 69-320]